MALALACVSLVLAGTGCSKQPREGTAADSPAAGSDGGRGESLVPSAELPDRPGASSSATPVPVGPPSTVRPPIGARPPADALAPGASLVVPWTETGHRVVALAGGRPESVRLLVGGDGIREASAAETARGIRSRPHPVLLGRSLRGYLWRAREGAIERTLLLGAAFQPPGEADRHTLTYLEAIPLETGGAHEGAGEWGLYALESGIVHLTGTGDVVADAILFAEIDGDTWQRLDGQRFQGPATMVIPDDRTCVVVVHRVSGEGGIRIRHEAAAPSRGGDATPRHPWRVSLADDGEMNSYWGAMSSPRHVLGKRLRVDRLPDPPRAARLSYYIGQDAYDPRTDVRAPARANWSNLVIELNGEVVLEARTDRFARKGWHSIDVPVSLVRRGENEIRFRVDGPDYAYLGVDTDTNDGRSGVVEERRLNPSTLRPGRSLRGEYLVRLAVR